MKRYYVNYTCNCDDRCRCGDDIESNDGDHYKVEDVKEEVFPLLKMLKWELDNAKRCYPENLINLIKELSE